MDQPVVT